MRPNENPTIGEVLDWFCEKMTPHYEGAEVLYGYYDTSNWEGYAYVLYKTNDNRFFEASGSHCSCYGLEDQWSPDEVDFEELKHRATKGTYFGEDAARILEIISEVEGNKN